MGFNTSLGAFVNMIGYHHLEAGISIDLLARLGSEAVKLKFLVHTAIDARGR